MHRHGFILAMLVGAGGLLIVLGSFLVLQFHTILTHYVGANDSQITVSSSNPPRLIAILQDTDIAITEIDSKGEPVRTVYSSSLLDNTPDFGLFAVPQEHYSGTAYMRSVQDAEENRLIIYPLDVATGKLAPWIINTMSDATTLSDNEEMLAVIDIEGNAQKITLYDLLTGTSVKSWTLGKDEWLSADPYDAANGYSGNGVRWTGATCFEHTVWKGVARRGTALTETEVRTFCNDGL